MRNIWTKVLHWLRRLFRRKPRTVSREWKWHPAPEPAAVFSPTKAYADQRQKAPHNRRRHPSKHMRNLYKL